MIKLISASLNCKRQIEADPGIRKSKGVVGAPGKTVSKRVKVSSAESKRSGDSPALSKYVGHSLIEQTVTLLSHFRKSALTPRREFL